MSEMNLDRALALLARIHTDDDHTVGFVVHSLPKNAEWVGASRGDYVEAWKAVRKHLHMPTEPGERP